MYQAILFVFIEYHDEKLIMNKYFARRMIGCILKNHEQKTISSFL